MTSPGGKLTALVCHLAKNLNKAEELTYLLTDIGTMDMVDSSEVNNPLLFDLNNKSFCSCK
jgi:hypothetical protein